MIHTSRFTNWQDLPDDPDDLKGSLNYEALSYMSDFEFHHAMEAERIERIAMSDGYEYTSFLFDLED